MYFFGYFIQVGLRSEVVFDVFNSLGYSIEMEAVLIVHRFLLLLLQK